MVANLLLFGSSFPSGLPCSLTNLGNSSGSSPLLFLIRHFRICFIATRLFCPILSLFIASVISSVSRLFVLRFLGLQVRYLSPRCLSFSLGSVVPFCFIFPAVSILSIYSLDIICKSLIDPLFCFGNSLLSLFSFPNLFRDSLSAFSLWPCEGSPAFAHLHP